jgi:hypothetical protein
MTQLWRTTKEHWMEYFDEFTNWLPKSSKSLSIEGNLTKEKLDFIIESNLTKFFPIQFSMKSTYDTINLFNFLEALESKLRLEEKRTISLYYYNQQQNAEIVLKLVETRHHHDTGKALVDKLASVSIICTNLPWVDEFICYRNHWEYVNNLSHLKYLRRYFWKESFEKELESFCIPVTEMQFTSFNWNHEFASIVFPTAVTSSVKKITILGSIDDISDFNGIVTWNLGKFENLKSLNYKRSILLSVSDFFTVVKQGAKFWKDFSLSSKGNEQPDLLFEVSNSFCYVQNHGNFLKLKFLKMRIFEDILNTMTIFRKNHIAIKGCVLFEFDGIYEVCELTNKEMRLESKLVYDAFKLGPILWVKINEWEKFVINELNYMRLDVRSIPQISQLCLSIRLKDKTFLMSTDYLYFIEDVIFNQLPQVRKFKIDLEVSLDCLGEVEELWDDAWRVLSYPIDELSITSDMSFDWLLQKMKLQELAERISDNLSIKQIKLTAISENGRKVVYLRHLFLNERDHIKEVIFEFALKGIMEAESGNVKDCLKIN